MTTAHLERFEPATTLEVVEDMVTRQHVLLIGRWLDIDGRTIGYEVTGLSRRREPHQLRLPRTPSAIAFAMGPAAPPRQYRED